MYTQPSIFKPFEKLVAAESNRHGGVSQIPYASLNLGLNTKDQPSNVIENRRRFFTDLQIPLTQVASSYQVHGNQILKVTKTGLYEGFDALITDQVNVFITVTVADCTPVLIYDKTQKAVAAIHAGWRGTVAQIVPKTITAMKHFYGSQANDCFVYIGTCIDECSFEVDADVADHFDNPFKKWDEKRAKYFVDLKEANKSQVLDSGVPENQIEVSPYSTVLNNQDYFSHRKESGTTGRMLAVIGMKK